MDRRDWLLSLVQSLLAAPGSEGGWQQFILQLCRALDGSAAKFIAHSLEAGAVTANVSVAVNTDPHAVEEYQQYWCVQDPWRNSMSRDVKAGAVLVGDELISPLELRRTAFYNEFGRRYDTTQCLAGILEMSARGVSNISVNRADGMRRFDRHDAKFLAVLMPHLDRAIQLHRQLCGAQLMAVHAFAVLDHFAQGILLISETGALLSTNRAADLILKARDGLTFERGELRAATPSITARLHAVLNTAARMSKREALDGETALSLPRPSGRRALSVRVIPLPTVPVILLQCEAAVAVFVNDPDHASTPDVNAIQIMLCLTKAESELVHCLAAGLNLERAAAHLGLRRETVRSRLKAIFQKTNTHRQAELVRRVLTSAAR